MPSIEDVFDDDTDLPLPDHPPASSRASTSRTSAARQTAASSSSSSNVLDSPAARTRSRVLANTGSRGALLEEIKDGESSGNDDDDDGESGFDMGRLREQSSGMHNTPGAPERARTTRSSTSTTTAMTAPGGGGGGGDVQRPAGPPMGGPPGGGGPPNMMNGMMGDLMKMQEAEEARMRKLERQLAVGMKIEGDPSQFKNWLTLYPIYFDAKQAAQSTGNGRRRVARSKAVWWPNSFLIAKACSALGLKAMHDHDKCHPADWRNPGRVKVIFEKDGQYFNERIKSRTQLYNEVATAIQRLVPQQQIPDPKRSSPTASVHQRQTANQPPQPLPPFEERFPINSPAVGLGVAVQAVRRDIEQEREKKKNAIAEGKKKGSGGGGGGGKAGNANSARTTDGKEAKPPKMKKMVVRARR